MKRVCLDSNVFIALMKTGIGRGLRGLFAEAQAFLERAKEQGCTIVLSYWFFKESSCYCHLTDEEITEQFNAFGVKIEVIRKVSQLQWKKFSALGLHDSDALHAAIAVDSRCDCIVTFNLKDFEKIGRIITVFGPAEFG